MIRSIGRDLIYIIRLLPSLTYLLLKRTTQHPELNKRTAADEYDLSVREMAKDVKAKPLDRLKTEEVGLFDAHALFCRL